MHEAHYATIGFLLQEFGDLEATKGQAIKIKQATRAMM